MESLTNNIKPNDENNVLSWLRKDEKYVFYIYEDDQENKKFIGDPLKASIDLLNSINELLPKIQKREGMIRKTINQIDIKAFLACLKKCIQYSNSFYSPIIIKNHENRGYLEVNAYKTNGNNNGYILVEYLTKQKRLPSNPDRIIKEYKISNQIESYKDHGCKIYRLNYLDNKNITTLSKSNTNLNDSEQFILKLLNRKNIINRNYIIKESGLSKSRVSANLTSLVLKGKIKRIGKQFSPKTFYIKNN